MFPNNVEMPTDQRGTKVDGNIVCLAATCSGNKFVVDCVDKSPLCKEKTGNLF
jgi:hypothetical protein